MRVAECFGANLKRQRKLADMSQDETLPAPEIAKKAAESRWQRS